MKLWRKQAMKAGKGTGRHIRNAARMQEYELQGTVKTYPLLDALFARAGMTHTLSRMQQETLRGMIAKLQAEKESADETQ